MDMYKYFYDFFTENKTTMNVPTDDDFIYFTTIEGEKQFIYEMKGGNVERSLRSDWIDTTTSLKYANPLMAEIYTHSVAEVNRKWEKYFSYFLFQYVVYDESTNFPQSIDNDDFYYPFSL